MHAAAALAEALFKHAPGCHILATSREPLRAVGERVQRLPALTSPPAPSATQRLTAAEALTFPAVQLFVERVAENQDGFELTDAEAPVVADICRRLDGIALAIELAASRVDAFGIRGLASHLDERFRVLTRGRRTALARHQTLGATLDWSYQILSEPERVVLRRLAVFAGDFTLASASAVAADDDVMAPDVIEYVANLVSKSLATADIEGPVTHYRLFDTARAYALEKLAGSGEMEAVSRRHAEHVRALYERADAEWEMRPTADWLATYGRQIDNLRAALDWSLSRGNAPATGAAAIAASTQLWLQNTLVAEGRNWIDRALHQPGATECPVVEARLHYAAGRLSSGDSIAEATVAFGRAASLSRELDDRGGLGCALMSLGVALARQGRTQEGEAALAEAQPLLAASNFRKSYARSFLDRALVVMMAGRFDESLGMMGEAASLARDAGAERGVIRAIIYLAECKFAMGRTAQAIGHGREAVALCRATRRSRHLGHVLCNLGAYLVHDGEVAEATSILKEGLVLARDELGSLSVALALHHFAFAATAAGAFEQGARLLGYADTAAAHEPTARISHDRALAKLREAMPADRIERLRDAGARLTEEQAIAEALAL